MLGACSDLCGSGAGKGQNALCIFEVESPPIGQINFLAAFTAACYTSALKHLAMRQNSWVQGPRLWDRWTRALGPVDPRAQGPGTCGQGPWALRPMGHGARGPGPSGPKGPVRQGRKNQQNAHRVIFYSFCKEIYALQLQAGHVTPAFSHFYGAFLHISTANCNVG